MAEHDGLWELVLEHSPVGMALLDLDGRLTLANHALCQILGYPADELVGLTFQEFTHPEDLEADLALVAEILAGERDSFRVDKRYLRKDGEPVSADLSVALVHGRDGEPLQFIAQIQDVTEERQAEEGLATANAQLQAIFDTADVGLLLIDRDGNYQRTNRTQQVYMKMPFPDGHAGTAGQTGYVFHLDGEPMTREEMPSIRAACGEEFDNLRFWVGRDPASRQAHSVSARRVLGPHGEFVGAALAYHDITDLVEAMQVRDQFVASVSHELRTPLTAVLGHLEILSDREDLPVDIARQLEVIQRNAVRLETLVTDLLHVARAREGKLSLSVQAVDLRALVHEAVDAARPAADSAAIRLTCDAQEVRAQADPHRLRQVADNLISNAIKYTDREGAVSVTLRRTEDRVELAISDTGMGIADADQELIFTKFFRAGEAESRHIPGTGLGLSIVQDIVEAHGGSIRLESEKGEGTTFTVSLPSQ